MIALTFEPTPVARTSLSCYSAHDLLIITARNMSEADDTLGGGSGNALPAPVLVFSGVCTAVAVFISFMSIYLHLKNYRKPHLQRSVILSGFSEFGSLTHLLSPRQVIRIMLMVPLYAIASFISLFSLEAAFFIDVIRDIYEVSRSCFSGSG